MVEDEMARARQVPDISLNEVKCQILQETPGGQIDFFGGEPTLYPHILEAIRFAREQGYECTMATNGRRFSDERFTRAIADLGLKHLRSTLLGHTDDLHNALSRGGKNSFSQTIAGFKNILRYGLSLQVNMVILRQNYQFLADMTRLLLDLGVHDLKFSSLLGAAQYFHLAVRFSAYQPYLRMAVNLALETGAYVSIEKTPMCVAPELLPYYLPESDMASQRYFNKELDECRRCSVRDWCYGLDSDYLRLFGGDEAHAIESVPREAIIQIDEKTRSDLWDSQNFHVLNLSTQLESLPAELLAALTLTANYPSRVMWVS
jgi:MoaA/NifB/PqqE/SkfB family radical SAM enzyme